MRARGAKANPKYLDSRTCSLGMALTGGKCLVPALYAA